MLLIFTLLLVTICFNCAPLSGCAFVVCTALAWTFWTRTGALCWGRIWTVVWGRARVAACVRICGMDSEEKDRIWFLGSLIPSSFKTNINSKKSYAEFSYFFLKFRSKKRCKKKKNKERWRIEDKLRLLKRNYETKLKLRFFLNFDWSWESLNENWGDLNAAENWRRNLIKKWIEWNKTEQNKFIREFLITL